MPASILVDGVRKQNSGVRTTGVGSRSIKQTSTRSPDDVWRAARSRRDLATAANIAGRLDPWGESLPWKSVGDDSPQDGSGCDTATGHHTPSPKPGQTTLVAFQS